MALTTRTLVEGAARQPLPYGLFSTFPFRPNSDRWQNGVKFEVLTCEPADGIGDPTCDPTKTIGLPKNLDRNGGELGEATSFTVYGHYTCNPLGTSPEQAQEKAKVHLLAREEARVEQALWKGDLGNAPALASKDTTVLDTSAVSPIEGLAALERFGAINYGALGVIHMSRYLASALMTAGKIQATGSRLTTKLGTPIVAGTGYPGTGPTGQSGSWAYITPALFGYRSEIIEPTDRPGDLLDRSNNTLYAIAERHYLIGYDPCGVAATFIDPVK